MNKSSLADTTGESTGVDQDFLALMRDQVDNKSKLVTQIQNEIQRIKQDPKRRDGFMKYKINLMDAKREARQEAYEEASREERQAGMQKLISTLQEVGIEPAVIKQKAMEKYGLSDAEVDKLLRQYN